ncbi:MAG: potassium-transporting ATPase subunit F [Caulobacteraceae bacterium]|nr:potassium-transporting ATPase subunit F [Caulobacteraceae bacterium]
MGGSHKPEPSDGLRLHRRWRGHVRPVRHLRRAFEARVTMVVAVIYIVATVAVTIYMLAALLRPEDF